MMAKQKTTIESRTIIKEDKIVHEIEDKEGYSIHVLPDKKRFNNGNFIVLFQELLIAIAIEGNLTKNEYQLLIYLIGKTGYDNSVLLDLQILSDDLGVKKSNISTALKGLVMRNIIIRKDGYRYGNQPLPMELSFNYDQLNYKLAYNGKIGNYSKTKHQHPEIEHIPPKKIENAKD